MFKAGDWMLFFTNIDDAGDFAGGISDFVSEISIDVTNNRYILLEKIPFPEIDAYDEDGKFIDSRLVSKAFFDLLVSGVKSSGFKECSYAEKL